jgi:DNA-binding protein HU-beta
MDSHAMALSKVPSKTPGKPAAKAAPAKPAGKSAATPAKAAPAATVTLKQVAAQLADAHALPKNTAESLATSLVSVLVQHLKAGDRLRIGGLGILEVKDRPARTGRNPATGATIQIAASKKIAFRPAKELKEAI